MKKANVLVLVFGFLFTIVQANVAELKYEIKDKDVKEFQKNTGQEFVRYDKSFNLKKPRVRVAE